MPRDEIEYALAVVIYKRTQAPGQEQLDDQGFSELSDREQWLFTSLAGYIYDWLIDQGWTPPT